MLCTAAAQAGNKPAISSATEVKTEPPSQSTEPVSDTAASTAVKQETTAGAASPAGETVTPTIEAASGSKDEKSEDKTVAAEDSDSEEKMDTGTSEQNKVEEAKEEVSFMSLVITFHISRGRGEMYCGHGCLCVCLSVPRRIPTLFIHCLLRHGGSTHYTLYEYTT